MALSPLVTRSVAVLPTTSPTRTYEFDFDLGEFTGGMLDGQTAIYQMMIKALKTARFRYLIYSAQYGSDIPALLGADVTDDFIQMEIPRMIRECLVVDDRVKDVTGFVVTRDAGSSSVYVEFSAVASNGDILTVKEVF